MTRGPLPYRWRPDGTRELAPELGNLVGLWHEVWRVVAVDLIPAEDWDDDVRRALENMRPEYAEAYVPRMVRLGPWQEHIDPKLDRDGHLGIRVRGGYRAATLPTYPGPHWPMCATCHEPTPCRETVTEGITEQAADRAARYETPGACPACGEVVTQRQRSITWETNTMVPLGPPVTFHLRRDCRWHAARYERAVAAETGQPTTLSCTGRITNHGDGTYSCSSDSDCPGARAEHQGYTVCHCPGHNPHSCDPAANARRVTS